MKFLTDYVAASRSIPYRPLNEGNLDLMQTQTSSIAEKNIKFFNEAVTTALWPPVIIARLYRM